MATRIKKLPAPDPTDPWLSVPEAARVLGISAFRVRTFALRGVLVGQTVAGRHFISRESVEKLRRDFQKAS